MSDKEIIDYLQGKYISISYGDLKETFQIKKALTTDNGVEIYSSYNNMFYMFSKEEAKCLVETNWLYRTFDDGSWTCVLSNRAAEISTLSDTYDKLQTVVTTFDLWCQEHVIHNLPPEYQEEFNYYLSDIKQLLRIDYE